MLVLVALGAAAGGTVARASAVGHHGARLAPADEVVLASSFHRMAGVTAIWASGDYVLLSKAAWTPSVLTGWVVINQRLGTSTLLDGSCHVDALGPPWVLIGCPNTSDPYGPYNAELYSLAESSGCDFGQGTGPAFSRPRVSLSHARWLPVAAAHQRAAVTGPVDCSGFGRAGGGVSLTVLVREGWRLRLAALSQHWMHPWPLPSGDAQGACHT